MHTECYPISILPRLSRLFLDYAESRQPLTPFYPASPYAQLWTPPEQDPTLRSRIADLLEEQNRAFSASPATLANIHRLRQGSPAIVTGQQVTLFGGPLFTLFKAATAIRKAQDTGAVPIFWLATEDHDLDEADHVVLPSRHELQTLRLTHDANSRPVGNLPLGPQIRPLLDQAAELLGPGPILDALEAAYTPEATFAQAFARLLTTIFADQGLILIDAAGPAFHALGAPVLRYAIEHAAELESALLDRSKLLESRGYHAQVLVAPSSSLLFLIDEDSGARLALKRKNQPHKNEYWTAGKQSYSTEDLLAILDSAPERLSPNALLRPVFQDFLLPTVAYIGGPAEISYFAQSQVLYEAILGRTTPVIPRLSAALVEPAVATLLAQHEVSLDDILRSDGRSNPDELAQRLGARAIPIEGKRKLASAGNALDEELTSLTQWMHQLDPGLGRSADVSASKMRYQMNRLRRLAANYQLQTEASLRRHVEVLYLNLLPDQHPQERIIGAAAFLARYGDSLVPQLIDQASQECPGHKAIFL
ncbi:MAG TPA: bacillithiol biosynthesis cysteine-adding enzyme BshC [Silvibacterium sp.]|nr:bacillithiol biosynthesis cysteine-adding enzyme BshC [Silvibacterium sp.]